MTLWRVAGSTPPKGIRLALALGIAAAACSGNQDQTRVEPERRLRVDVDRQSPVPDAVEETGDDPVVEGSDDLPTGLDAVDDRLDELAGEPGMDSSDVEVSEPEPEIVEPEPEPEMMEPEPEPEPPPPLEFIENPAVTLNDNLQAPLAALVDVRTNRADHVDAIVTGGGEEWTVPIPTLEGAGTRALLGFKPDTEYSVTISASTDSEIVTSEPSSFTTPPMPADFPELLVSISEPERMEPGMTLFNVREQGLAYLVVVDAEGSVRWYHRGALRDGQPAPLADHDILSNGNLIFDSNRWQLSEIDWLGVERQRWYAAAWPGDDTPPEGATPVDTDTFHHEISEMPNGNLMVLSAEKRTVEGFPTTYRRTETETAEVVGDVLVEFQRDGTIVGKYSLLDQLDPRRIGYGSLGAFWDSTYGEPTRDWSHANAAFYDVATDSFLISVRHQDAVVKIRREDGSLWWILGAPDYWQSPWSEHLLTPVGSIDWQFHQHAVKLTPRGGIGMFDNGNSQALPPDAQTPAAELNSRAVEFLVDDDQMTIVQAWSYGPRRGAPGGFFSDFISDADWLPHTGNVLVTPGGQDAPVEAGQTVFDFSQIIEVTAGGGRVFELTIMDDLATAQSRTIYRSERVPDIRFR